MTRYNIQLIRLNKQHDKIQYTIDKEDENKMLQFIDIGD